MGLTPTERSRLHRERKRATAPPDKSVGRVPDPRPTAVEVPVIEYVPMWMFKAVEARLVAQEDAMETLRGLVFPPKPKPTVAELRQRILPPPVLSDAQRQAAAETQGAP